MSPPVYISIKKFCDIYGMKEATIRDAINRGRIVSCRKSRKNTWEVHQIKALQEFHDNKKVNQYTMTAKERREQVLAQSAHAEVSAHIPSEIDAGKSINPTTFKTSLDEESIPDLETSKARTEHYRAQKAKADYLKTAGDLVDRKEVAKAYRKIAKTVKDNILKVPDRLAPMIAIETDERTIINLLDDGLREALEFLAEGDIDEGNNEK